ncbi:aromatic ring-opening dioxygenase LigA [Cellulomonas sp.]|uniref:aromatic ring-opening dioxygenase LigA n=1 Tax=Cellulomonas sp. TaxID=40001 RepID=UPI001B2F22FF|nr:aromatic ring-opening dioxygenase LigA [Cellulomonas sp.]MBO9556214.1 aromatic ring-opening dioxygenase LigA [Cellulomonas sp.]
MSAQPTAIEPDYAPEGAPATRRVNRRARTYGTLLVVLGVIMLVAGVGAWGAVAQGLGQEKVDVTDTAPAFVGQRVDAPWEAWAQSEAIRTDLQQMTDGRTYAEVDREDPIRPSVATGTFLRASLMTSVIAFGVSLAVVGVGVGFVLGGLGLRSLARRDGGALTA